LSFPGAGLPEVGSRVRVYERILLKKGLLGEFEIIGADRGAAVARPVGRVDLELIRPSDEAIAF
jgi:hypothetical protein